ncbi:hypothetical protein OEA41_007918 [Lepraria neglecta]|uniref:Uncharacterized protein n=1 Tax=Lepraria neglecta TaxID=209136 RepID=A0AAE0DQR5_9LECA|nr:hypothetical protein OEA41_007918 [Lepraria neglecta]
MTRPAPLKSLSIFGALMIAANATLCPWMNHSTNAVTLPPPVIARSCSGCTYVIDVLEIFWNTDIYTHTTATVIVKVDKASNKTRTSTVQGTRIIHADIVEYFSHIPLRPRSRLVTDKFEVTNSLGYVICTSSTTDFGLGLLFSGDIPATGLNTMAQPNEFAARVNLNCTQQAISPPQVLLPISALTATITTQISGVPPHAPDHVLPAPAVNALTVAPTQQVPPPAVQAMGPGSNAHGNPVADSSPPQPVPGNKPPTEQGLPGSTPNEPAPEANGSPTQDTSPPKSQDLPPVIVVPSPKTERPAAAGAPQDILDNNPQQLPLPEIAIGTETYQATTFPTVIIAHSILIPNSIITISSNPIVLLPGGSSIAIGGSTLTIPASAAVPNVGSNRVTANKAGAFVFAGQTAAPGAPAITVSGTTISIQAQESSVVINGVTSAITHNSSPVVLDGQTFSPGIASGYILYSTPLMAGCAPITVSGTPYSLATGATTLVVGSRTQLFTPSAPTPAPNVIEFAGSIYAENAASQYIISGQTLSPGSAMIVSGTVLSLAPGATAFRRRGKHADSHPFTNPLSTGLDLRRIGTY